MGCSSTVASSSSARLLLLCFSSSSFFSFPLPLSRRGCSSSASSPSTTHLSSILSLALSLNNPLSNSLLSPESLPPWRPGGKATGTCRSKRKRSAGPSAAAEARAAPLLCRGIRKRPLGRPRACPGPIERAQINRRCPGWRR